MTTTARDDFEIDYNALEAAAATAVPPAASAPRVPTTNVNPSACSKCGVRLAAGAGIMVNLGSLLTTRCARCAGVVAPAPALAPVPVAAPVPPPVPVEPPPAVFELPEWTEVPTPTAAPEAAPAPPVEAVDDDLGLAPFDGAAAPAPAPAPAPVAAPAPVRAAAVVAPVSTLIPADSALLRATAVAVGTAPEAPVTVATVVEIVNRFAAPCRACGGRVTSGGGHAYRIAPAGRGTDAWATRHRACPRVDAYVWTPPAAVAPAPVATAPVPPAAVEAVAPVAAVDRGLADALTDAVATGEAMAAGYGLVRGGVLPQDVRGVGVVASARANMLVNSEASARAIGGTTERAADAPRPVAPTTIQVQPAHTGPVRISEGMSPALAATIEASRARQGTLTRSAVPVTVHLGAPPVQAIANPVLRADAARASTAAVKAIKGAITDGAVIAGAAEDASGALIGWTGRRERTRAQLADALAQAGAPAEWLPPAKSARAHAGRAVDSANAWTWRESRLVARAAKDLRDDSRNGVVARWTLQSTRAATGQVGEAAGQILLTVELRKVRDGHAIQWRGESDLGVKVEREFARLAAEDVYKAADVTAWLTGVLKGKLAAVDFGPGSLYIRKGEVAAAERLCTALADQGWGINWILPALPIATSTQLRAGLVRAFAAEAAAVVHRAHGLLKAARDAKRDAIGAGSAESLRKELVEVKERCAAYAELLGGEAIAAVHATVTGALTEIDQLCDPTTARAFMLELD